MSTVKVLTALLVAILAAGSLMKSTIHEVSVVQINSRWNSVNSIDLGLLRNCNKENLYLEDQPFSVQRNLPNVPVLIVYKGEEKISMYGGNIMLEPTVSVEEIQAVIDANSPSLTSER